MTLKCSLSSWELLVFIIRENPSRVLEGFLTAHWRCLAEKIQEEHKSCLQLIYRGMDETDLFYACSEIQLGARVDITMWQCGMGARVTDLSLTDLQRHVSVKPFSAPGRQKLFPLLTILIAIQSLSFVCLDKEGWWEREKNRTAQARGLLVWKRDLSWEISDKGMTGITTMVPSTYFGWTSLAPQATNTCREHHYGYQVLLCPKKGVRKFLQNMQSQGNVGSPVMHRKGRKRWHEETKNGGCFGVLSISTWASSILLI